MFLSFFQLIYYYRSSETRDSSSERDDCSVRPAPGSPRIITVSTYTLLLTDNIMVPYILLYSIHPSFVTLVFFLWRFIKIPANQHNVLVCLNSTVHNIIFNFNRWLVTSTPNRRRDLDQTSGALLYAPGFYLKIDSFNPAFFLETSV